MDAARHWASGGKQNLSAQTEALSAMGIEADLSEREQQCVDLEVWPENEPALTVFGAMLTQWHKKGLIYTALPTVMGFLKIPPEEQPDVFADLQILELETIKALGAKYV